MKRTIRALVFILLIVLASFALASCGSKTKEVVGTYYLYNVKVDGETEDAAEYIAEEKENGNTLIIILRKDGTGSMIDHNLMSYGEETMDFSWKMGKKKYDRNY